MVKTILLALLMLTSLRADPQDRSSAIYIPPETTSVRIGQFQRYGSDAILFEGTLVVHGVVRNGRIADGPDDPSNYYELQFKPDRESELRLPRFSGCTNGACISTFILAPDSKLALALYGQQALQALQTRQAGSLSVRASLRIGRIELDGVCGFHYRAEVGNVLQVAPKESVEVGPTISPHC